MRWSVLLLLVISSQALAGRMYQWVDPDTGTPYLSGSPPAWYRSVEGGPRVQVYEEGRLVDDTQWRADRVRERALREQALQAERARQEAEKERRLTARLEEQEEQAETPSPGGGGLAGVDQPEVIKALADDLLERFYKAKLKAAAGQEGELRGEAASP